MKNIDLHAIGLQYMRSYHCMRFSPPTKNNEEREKEALSHIRRRWAAGASYKSSVLFALQACGEVRERKKEQFIVCTRCRAHSLSVSAPRGFIVLSYILPCLSAQ